MCDPESDEYWEDFETCPDGFCRHWSCNCDCDVKCAKCGEGCPNHVDDDHPFEDPS